MTTAAEQHATSEGITEGKVSKGGQNARPTSKRPPPPSGQGGTANVERWNQYMPEHPAKFAADQGPVREAKQ